MSSNIMRLFDTSLRVSNMNPLDPHAVWPQNIEVCITRIPIRKRDGYDADMIKKLITKLKTHMVPNGIVFLICYAPTEAKFRPFEVANMMVNEGFTHIDNIVIEKTWFPGKRSETNLVNSHEYVLHFCNGLVWKLDRLPVRQYLKTSETISCPGNTWKVETGSLDESYPLDLAELLIRMTDSLPGSVIFDPFMGTQSSFRAAIKLGHSFYGFEQDARKMKKYDKIAKELKDERNTK